MKVGIFKLFKKIIGILKDISVFVLTLAAVRIQVLHLLRILYHTDGCFLFKGLVIFSDRGLVCAHLILVSDLDIVLRLLSPRIHMRDHGRCRTAEAV